MLNRGYAYITIISSEYHGQTLLSHLASLYPHSTPQAWQQKLNNGEVTLPGGGFMENTLLRLVQKQTPNANPVHRLGRATTGIVLFAKTPRAASHLFANWNTAKVQKIYRALAQNI